MIFFFHFKLSSQGMNVNSLFITFIATLWLSPNFVDLKSSNLSCNGTYLIRVEAGDMNISSEKDAEFLKTNEVFHTCGMEQSCIIIAGNQGNGIQFPITEDFEFALTNRWKNIWMKINPGNKFTLPF